MNSSENYIRSITDIVPNTNQISQPYSLFGLSWKTWIIIILILALLGINIFVFLAKGTQETASIIQRVFGPILKLLGYSTLNITKQTIEKSASGTTAAVDAVAGTAINTIDAIENKAMSNSAQQQTSLDKALSNSAQQQNEVAPDDSRSTIQTTGKSGWCYIGEEQNIRSCAPVGVNDYCMSGDIFPTQDVCVNPKLRV
jgi:hypothetical protein